MFFKEFFAERERKLQEARKELERAIQDHDAARQRLIETPKRMEAERKAAEEAHEQRMAEGRAKLEALRMEHVRLQEEHDRKIKALREETERLRKQAEEYNRC